MTLSGRAARLVRVAAAAGLALSGFALFSPAAGASTGLGWLRLAHLSPNTPAVDVYLYSFGNPHAKIVLHHVAYGTVSGYEHVPDGEYTVAMRLAGAKSSTKPVLSTTVDVVGTNAYTVAGMGPASGLRLRVYQDRLKAPRSKALVRLIQASMAQDTVGVTANGKSLASKLTFASVTSYSTLRPGLTHLEVTGSSEHASEMVKLAADGIYTLVVLDNHGHLKIASLTDAMGSKVQPDGGAMMGFGGTAAQPGAALAPWAAVAGAGLAAAAGGLLFMSRRRRRPCMRADKRQLWAEEESWPAGWHTSPARVVRLPAAAIVLLLGLLAAGGGATGALLASRTGHPATPAGKAAFVPVPAGQQVPGPEPTVGSAAPSPVRLVIPRIGVSARVIRLGLTATGELQPPASTAVAGWYTGSPSPGTIGSSVIGGHIDSVRGPGVFFRLRELRRGDRIYVLRRGGSLAVFVVTGVHEYPKDKFPRQTVYGPTPDAALRLITCGGVFDYATRHYLSNVVVFAILRTRPGTVLGS